MNRQQKELQKKAQEIYGWVIVDEQLGCGFTPPNAHEKENQAIADIEDEMARLRGFRCAMDRWMYESECFSYAIGYGDKPRDPRVTA